MIEIIHGRPCVKINGLYYAVDIKQHGKASRIAMQSRSTGCVFERVQKSARNNNNKHVFAK